jgi:hypothetical protein
MSSSSASFLEKYQVRKMQFSIRFIAPYIECTVCMKETYCRVVSEGCDQKESMYMGWLYWKRGKEVNIIISQGTTKLRVKRQGKGIKTVHLALLHLTYTTGNLVHYFFLVPIKSSSDSTKQNEKGYPFLQQR